MVLLTKLYNPKQAKQQLLTAEWEELLNILSFIWLKNTNL